MKSASDFTLQRLSMRERIILLLAVAVAVVFSGHTRCANRNHRLFRKSWEHRVD